MTACCDILVSRDPYELYQGESRHWVLSVTQQNTGMPQSIAGAKLYLTVRARIENVDTLILLRNQAAGGSDSQILIRPDTGIDIGKADVYTSVSDSSTIIPGDYWIDAWVVLTTGEHRPIIRTRAFKIRPAVTRF